jgi:hypothetical protein
MSQQNDDTTSPLDNVFVVYPKHLMWLMQDHNLTVSEICVALGLPSLQEWYNIIGSPDQPVRNTRIVQIARLYLRKPSLLPVKKTPLRELMERTNRVFGDETLGRKLLEAMFHKQWGSIENWLYDDELKIDLSARRLTTLLMELEDEEFKAAVLDAAVSTRAQVNAEEIETHLIDKTAERLYVSPAFGKMTIHKVLEIIPKPGRRIPKSAYVIPDTTAGQFQSQVAAARTLHDGTDSASEELSDEAKKAIQMAPWNRKKNTKQVEGA